MEIIMRCGICNLRGFSETNTEHATCSLRGIKTHYNDLCEHFTKIPKSNVLCLRKNVRVHEEGVLVELDFNKEHPEVVIVNSDDYPRVEIEGLDFIFTDYKGYRISDGRSVGNTAYVCLLSNHSIWYFFSAG